MMHPYSSYLVEQMEQSDERGYVLTSVNTTELANHYGQWCMKSKKVFIWLHEDQQTGTASLRVNTIPTGSPLTASQKKSLEGAVVDAVAPLYENPARYGTNTGMHTYLAGGGEWSFACDGFPKQVGQEVARRFAEILKG